jgi:2-octaprenyl-6-methoxyphenol hydroxylase
LAGIDVLIHGAGPTGCALALGLLGSGKRVALLERETAASPGFRPIALSHASRLILERLGVWKKISPSTIETIRVSQAGGFGRTTLVASDAAVPALGYVVDYAALARALRAAVAATPVQIVREPMQARCEVHAEGISEGREKRYAQDALVALVTFDAPATSVAYERFTADGPLALLPFEGRFALIWSMSPDRAATLAAADEETFLKALAAAAGTEAGRPRAAGERVVQPLVLRVRGTRVENRSVFIGNAAQTLHPVAGQGLNLGLRDAWELAGVLRDALDPGSPETLARYAARRRLDAQATIRITDFLAGSFLGSGSARRATRGIALAALDLLPGPRRFFARRMIFGPSALP